jgi:antitoxin FitA
VKAELRVRAAKHGRSMEEEARIILRDALSSKGEPRADFAQSMRRHVAPMGGIELKLQEREALRSPVKLP